MGKTFLLSGEKLNINILLKYKGKYFFCSGKNQNIILEKGVLYTMENRSIIQSNFIIANRDLINKFGVNSAILLGELYGRYNYFRKRNQLKNFFFFATKNSIERSTKLTPYKQRTASSILENVDILEVKYIDIPPKTYYKINEINLMKVLKNSVVDNMNN